jgi:DNA-binding CsgD family transcriptional regulator
MDEGHDTGGKDAEVGLSEVDLGVYQALHNEGGDFDADDPRLENLRRLGVVFTEPFTGKPGTRALPYVERAFYQQELDEIDARIRRMREIAPVLDALHDAVRGRANGAGVIEVLADVRAVNTVIHNAIERSVFVWSSQTLPRATDGLAMSAVRDIALMRAKNIQYRNLYPTSARMRAAETEYARSTAETGHAESRTSARKYPRMVLTDTVGVISDVRVGEGSNEPAIVIRHPALLAWLHTMFDREWAESDPWFPMASDSPSDRELVERDVLHLLSTGHNRESICRQLEISPRTYTNYMAALRERYGAKTNEQLLFTFGQRVAASAQSPGGAATSKQ